ncbi:hypothetical protein NP511_22660 (plasmid) [Natrinema thermotolerans]|uniref:Uncharacterized protein n=1 Tax=Natrinema thermotolerans TaxID=121872 RepID=A0AAF0T3S6_9EURY|nr:hypothetical protein [Natrinema thermotolerans]WMT10338.1 hypothetical protein NP511_22660 [Natrinema thermotolerans]
MNRRILLGTVLLMILLAGCSTTTNYTTSVGEPTTGTVIENASAEFVDDWSGVQYEIEYNSSYRNNSSYSFKVYEHVNGSLEFVDQSTFSNIEPSTPPTYRNDVAPPWDSGEKRVYEIRVVDDTTDTIIDAVTITIENEGS